MRFFISAICLLLSFSATQIFASNTRIKDAPNEIKFPDDYRKWEVISLSHRLDHESMRVILGNDVAVEAARSGKTNPWPEGTVLAKVVWKQQMEANWPTAIAPDQFIHVEFMFKNSNEFTTTAGWGYARWVGEKLEPFGDDERFVEQCVACHTPVKNRDWVYTTPAVFP